jgi:tetratricopeptide (TPR) repeat protein
MTKFVSISLILMVLFSCGESASSLEEQGNDALEQNDFAAAIEFYTQALELDSELDKSFFNRGRCHFALSDFDNAMSDFDQSLELNANNQPLHFNKALCLMELKQYAEALTSFDKVDSIGENKADLLLQKANCHFKLGAYANAINFYDQAQPFFEDSISINLLRGTSSFQLGKFTDALVDLEYYLTFDPDHPLALEYTALASFGSGNFENTVANFEVSIENGVVLVGDNLSIYIDALVFTALESKAEDDYETALGLLTKANELDPNNKDGFLHRGLLFLEMGTREAACEDLNTAFTNGQLKALDFMKYSCPTYFE